MPTADSLTERELTHHLGALLERRGLTLLGEQVRIGSFRLDAVAHDPAGRLVVVEVKTTRWCGTLAQLLLYPRALRKALSGKGARVPPIRSLLVTTYLDSGLVDVIDEHELSDVIELAVCVGSVSEGLHLVDANDPRAVAALWDQAEGSCDVGEIVRWINA